MIGRIFLMVFPFRRLSVKMKMKVVKMKKSFLPRHPLSHRRPVHRRPRNPTSLNLKLKKKSNKNPILRRNKKRQPK